MVDEGGVCTSCGVCCAMYRVSFLRHELDSEPGGWVPAAFTELINDRDACMRGTKDVRDAALRYREFLASMHTVVFTRSVPAPVVPLRRKQRPATGMRPAAMPAASMACLP